MTQKELAEIKLKGMLAACELPVKGSYCTSEICSILGIGDATFWRLLAKYEVTEGGDLKRPDCLASFTLSQNRRVAYPELVDFLQRNNTYQRQYAVDPAQMQLFSEDD